VDGECERSARAEKIAHGCAPPCCWYSIEVTRGGHSRRTGTTAGSGRVSEAVLSLRCVFVFTHVFLLLPPRGRLKAPGSFLPEEDLSPQESWFGGRETQVVVRLSFSIFQIPCFKRFWGNNHQGDSGGEVGLVAGVEGGGSLGPITVKVSPGMGEEGKQMACDIRPFFSWKISWQTPLPSPSPNSAAAFRTVKPSCVWVARFTDRACDPMATKWYLIVVVV